MIGQLVEDGTPLFDKKSKNKCKWLCGPAEEKLKVQLTQQPWPSWVERSPRASAGPSWSFLCLPWPYGKRRARIHVTLMPPDWTIAAVLLLLKRDLKKSRHSSKLSVNKVRKHNTSKHQRARGFQGHVWILKESKLQLRICGSSSTLTSTMSTLCNMWGRKRDNG